MKFNLYIPTQQEKDEWELYAAKTHRSLSQFVRLAVMKEIKRIKKKEKV